jgi:hypothetical protein
MWELPEPCLHIAQGFSDANCTDTVNTRRYGREASLRRSKLPSSLCLGLQSLDPFPLDCKWIYAVNKPINQVSSNLHEWRIQKTHFLGIVSAWTEHVKRLSNCHALSKSQHIDFIERADTPDLPFNNMWPVQIDEPRSIVSNPCEAKRKDRN